MTLVYKDLGLGFGVYQIRAYGANIGICSPWKASRLYGLERLRIGFNLRLRVYGLAVASFEG